jgi:hypothetical protein
MYDMRLIVKSGLNGIAMAKGAGLGRRSYTHDFVRTNLTASASFPCDGRDRKSVDPGEADQRRESP